MSIKQYNDVGTASTILDFGQPIADRTVALDDLAPKSNPVFSGKILGDFSNATHANRTMFNANVANTSTVVGISPTGSGVAGQLNCYGLSDVNNSPILAMIAQSTILGIHSTAVGTGANQPMAFFAGGAERLRIGTSGNVLVTSAAGLGYGTGSGGTVTQLTSKATDVTLNKPTGQIVMHNASLAAGATVAFMLYSNLLSVGDLLIANHTNANSVNVQTYNSWSNVASAGVAYIMLKNISGAALAQSVEIEFAIIKGARS